MNSKEKIYCQMIGKAIRELRIEQTGKSSLLFAYENDISKSTLSRIERGENEAQLVTLKKIAEAFGWSMAELFYNIENKLPNDFHIFNDEHY
ncbi:MAG: helix-turn-helix domain-containing protein [Candidatus Gastranaerophilaceae bacterium]